MIYVVAKSANVPMPIRIRIDVFILLKNIGSNIDINRNVIHDIQVNNMLASCFKRVVINSTNRLPPNIYIKNCAKVIFILNLRLC